MYQLLYLFCPQPGRQIREPPGAWWERILAEGKSDNGVWAGKLMWRYTDDLLARVRELPGLQVADLDATLRRLLDDPLLVVVTRGDKVAQAVSLWRALQTQSCRADDASPTESGVYAFAAIDHLVSQPEFDERAWTRWFRATGRQPLEVTYDQLDSAPAETVAVVLDALGLPDETIGFPRLSRQRDRLSAIWIERYRLERDRAA